MFRFVWFVRVLLRRLWNLCGSSGSFTSALGVAGFVCVSLVSSFWPLGSFGFVGFVWVRTVCRWVLLRSSSSLSAPWWIAWLFRVRLLSPFAPWVSLDSFGFVWFVWVLPRGVLVLSDSFGSLGNLPGGRWVLSGSFGCTPGVDGFVRVLMVRLGATCMSPTSFALVWFIQVPPRLSFCFIQMRPAVGWVHSG